MEQYIAGFFDGEGNVNKIKVKKHTYHQLRMWQAGERGLKLLEEIKSFLGYGNINCKKQVNPKHQIVYELSITRKFQIKDFKDRIGKYCRMKDFPRDEELVYLGAWGKSKFGIPNSSWHAFKSG